MMSARFLLSKVNNFLATCWLTNKMASMVVQLVKNLPAIQETQVLSLGQEDPLEEEMATPPVFLPGEFHGWATVHRIIESDMTEWLTHTAAAAKSLQLCPTLCDPIDGSPPGSTVPGILQARTLEWVAISFSNAWKWKAKVKSLSRVQLLATPWTAAHTAPPSVWFSRQEYWSGVPLPSLTHTQQSK